MTKTERIAGALFDCLTDADDEAIAELKAGLMQLDEKMLKSIRRRPFASQLLDAMNEAIEYHDDMNAEIAGRNVR